MPRTPADHRTRPTPALPPLLLDLPWLVRLLGRSRASIARDVTAGRMPAPVRIGRSVRWQHAVIAAWVADGCPPGGPPSSPAAPST